MEGQMKINDQVTVAGQPSEEELRHIVNKGFASVINLRTDNEEDLPMTPQEEEKTVRSMGMAYVNIPVSISEEYAGSEDNYGVELVNRFREEFRKISKPVLVHCKKGKRSGAFVMMDIAVRQGWSGDDTVKKAEDMGFECDNEKLVEFVKSYIDSHKNKK